LFGGGPTLIQVKNIKKSFGATQALKNLSFEISDSEVHALVGENGAGKSTLVKIISGVLKPDQGEIFWNGERLNNYNIRIAMNLGIRAVHQEIDLIDNMTVLENLMLGREKVSSLGTLDYKQMKEDLESFVKSELPEIPPLDKIVKDLDIMSQQMVVIARALFSGCNLLILDEPTAVLSDNERNVLFSVVRRLKAGGTSVLFISHRLEEVFLIADRVTVLKDGEHVSTLSTAMTNSEELVRLMSGREISELYPSEAKKTSKQTTPAIELRGYSCGKCTDVNLKIYPGEIFGFGGLMGQGQEDLIRGLFGIIPHSGNVLINGEIVPIDSVKSAIEAGISFVSANRERESLVLCRSIRENICMPILHELSFLGIMRFSLEKARATNMMKLFKIKANSPKTLVSKLSGGNKQKVSLCKSLVMKPRILMLHEPTRGVDVQTRFEIYRKLREIADDGIAVIVVSSDTPELLGICDKIAVFYEGALKGILKGKQKREDILMALANNQKVVMED